ncbi:hypothetical protein SteCoe_36361 [Stentor coeruleus]|uniref:Cyclic nucleotide-binding domain-containing protein n=1 Tax=Stentor coeruleus TaxID=5963 RepID=A0A1R2AQM7_9CILI|nr:hypothetical protein SteCoe_36361 [Stentor coeruleus]
MFISKNDEISDKLSSWKNKWLLKPEEYSRFSWEMFVMIVLILLGFLLPYISAFEPSNTNLSRSIDIFTICIFSIDILINFNTGFYEKGTLIMERSKIIKNYLTFWFWLDLISTLPLDWILEIAGSVNSQASKLLKYIRILRVLKLIKLIRLTKLKLMIIRIQDRISNKKILSLITVFKLLLYLFLIAHFFACIMFSVSSENMGPDTFVAGIVNKSDMLVLKNNDLYVSCLYWAFVTMASIGYGDYSPKTSYERIFGVMTMITSSCMFGFIVGNIGTIIEKHSVKERQRRDILVQLNMYMRKNKFSIELTNKIRKYIEFVFFHDQNTNVRINDLLSLLSLPLQEEIMMHTNGVLISKCPVFSIFTDSFVHRFARILESKFFSPNDSIIKEGQASKGMFFINSGLILIYENLTHCKIKELCEGSFVGEIGLFTRQSCVASVSAVNFVETFCLGFADFYKLIDLHPAIKQTLDSIRASCIEGNYLSLGVKCYLCRKIGHIARNCDEIMNDDRVRRDWINSKVNSRYIVPEIQDPLVYKRKHRKKIQRRDYSCKNIIGSKRKPREMFPKVTSLVRGIVGYLNNKKKPIREPEENVLLTEESMMSSYTMNMFRHPELVLSSEENSDEGERVSMNFIRDERFDMRLLR